MRVKQQTRGLRNNNPLNIRIGNAWLGEVEKPTDHQFEQFKEMKWGVRAAFIILRNYIRRHGLNTVRKIITRWAPGNENNTAAYIKTVCERTGYEPDQRLTFCSAQMLPLFQAMCFVENGQTISQDDVIAGWRLV